jgi:hypothetical protein
MITEAGAPVQRVTIRLKLAKDPTQRAALTAHVRARDDGQLRLSADIAEAVAAGGGDAAALRESELDIIKTEIMGGAVTAKKHAKRGCTVELVALSGSTADGGLTSVPSIAFAVATSLAVLQGLGVEDLRSAPRGGYGWALEGVEVAEAR